MTDMQIRQHVSPNSVFLKYRRCGDATRYGTLPAGFSRSWPKPPDLVPNFAQPDARTARPSGDTVSMSTLTYQGHEVLYTREQIASRVIEMGAQITHDLNGEKLVMIGVLKGAAPFLADLARAIQADATFDFVAVSSYGKGQRSSGAVKLIKDLDEPIEGKNVLVVEDILDTGLTLAYLRKLFLQQHPKTLRIATLLDKPSRRIERIEADYVGFSIPNLFVIGYGMDYAERYRNLPDICLMSPANPE
jgi:hypoxanthine phosphoribosyltransferase